MNLSNATKHEHRGVTFYVGPRAPCSGIGWSIPTFDGRGGRESQGAFYDDCQDHPEGAEAWAEAACRSFIDGMLGEENP
jgi:hypothetical protein